MIYLDNAATTAVKPQCVIDAVSAALTCALGSVGRGVHGASLDAGSIVFGARKLLAELFGAADASCVTFTLNATEALNTAIAGLLPVGGRAITSAASHNSVLRPLYRARDERGCSVETVPVGADGALDWAAFEAAVTAGPADLVVMTHASNVTGDVYDAARMARLAHESGAVFVLDVAQSAGHIPIDMSRGAIDIIAFSGHKGLFGPQGTGGLVVRPGLRVPPLKVGGAGFDSFNEHHPARMPEALEAGTLNTHGIAGLAAGVDFVLGQGVDAVGARVAALATRFRAEVARVPGVVVYGGGEGGAAAACTGIVALNLADMDSAELAGRLANDYDIAVRAGAHCAPLMHRALGTEGQGVARFSFSALSTDADVDAAIGALKRVAADEARA